MERKACGIFCLLLLLLLCIQEILSDAFVLRFLCRKWYGVRSLTFSVIQIATYFRICVMQNVNLLDQCRQQFRVVQRILRVRFIFATSLWRLIVIGIRSKTRITETDAKMETENQLSAVTVERHDIFTVCFPNHPIDRFVSCFCSTLGLNSHLVVD